MHARSPIGSRKNPYADALDDACVPGDRKLLGCWINPRWSAGLDVADTVDWAETDREGPADPGSSGLVAVMVARADRSSRVCLSGFLVDVYCLGVKNTLGPSVVSSSVVRAKVDRFFGAFEGQPRSAPLELAQHVVHGAVSYAHALGFEPHPEFADVAPYLGPATGPCPITFGRDGKPFYISGPDDDVRDVMSTLRSTAGAGNFHFLSHV